VELLTVKGHQGSWQGHTSLPGARGPAHRLWDCAEELRDANRPQVGLKNFTSTRGECARLACSNSERHQVNLKASLEARVADRMWQSGRKSIINYFYFLLD